MHSLKKISEIIHADAHGLSDVSVSHLLTDSRQLAHPEETLFVALTTKSNDGHNYIPFLYDKGVRAFLVQFIPESCQNLKEACFLVVPNVLKAFQQIAAFHRSQFHIPIIGITGSNGKTIVKEWLYQLLKDDYHICRSPKSYNSQIGVPLSVWQLNNTHTLGIFEAGISHPGEMSHLSHVIEPTIGILTNLGTAHDEGFPSELEKLTEKVKLFSSCDTTIVNLLSNPTLNTQVIKSKAVFIISDQAKDSLQITKMNTGSTQTVILGIYQKTVLSITIPFTDSASIQNAITCWAVMLNLGYQHQVIEQRMLSLIPVALRLEVKQGINNSVVINDYYNSDINSLNIALQFLNQQHRGGQKVLVLSDIEQSGKETSLLYKEIAHLLYHHKINVLIGIGKHLSENFGAFDLEKYFFASTSDFISRQASLSHILTNATILLKGSRSFGFEAIGKMLQQKSHDTVLEINLNALIQNINFYRSQLKKGVKLMCMVKATGYGNGSSEIAFTLQHHGVDYLAVAYADEGVELRKAGIHIPIMVMNPEENAFDDIIHYQLEPELFSFRVLKQFVEALKKHAVSKAYPVHLKLDTGMKRLGFEEEDITELIHQLQNEKSIFIKSAFSHLVASDDASFDDFTEKQIYRFETMCRRIENVVTYPFIKHICNSGAITRFKQAHYDMVRLGIGMYGVGFNDVEKKNLINVSSLKTKISQIKALKVGESVGYSRRGVAQKDTRIATIPIGYADGFSRKLGNGAFHVLIRGKACPTIGNICMDMCMVDVSNIDCREGDDVVVFDNNDGLMDLSKSLDTIPYEVLTGLSTRVKRVYVQE